MRLRTVTAGSAGILAAMTDNSERRDLMRQLTQRPVTRDPAARTVLARRCAAARLGLVLDLIGSAMYPSLQERQSALADVAGPPETAWSELLAHRWNDLPAWEPRDFAVWARPWLQPLLAQPPIQPGRRSRSRRRDEAIVAALLAGAGS
jgi:hypothetical protein